MLDDRGAAGRLLGIAGERMSALLAEKAVRAGSYEAGVLSMQSRLFDQIAQNSTDSDERETWAKGAGTLRLVLSFYIEGIEPADYAGWWIEAARMTLMARDDEIHAERVSRR